PPPRQYRNDAQFQRRLNAFFLRTDGEPALGRLDELGEKYGIGGARPYISIRAAAKDRSATIVIRHTEDKDGESTGIPAGDMTLEQAQKHPPALSVLARFAEDKLFELRITNAPATVMYSTVIARYLDTRDPSTGDPQADRRSRKLNKLRNIRDPQGPFDTMKARARVLIAEFFKGRMLERKPKRLPTEIKQFLVRKCLKAGATRDKHGQVKGALDTNVAAYVSLVRQALDWVLDTFDPQISLTMDSFKPKTTRSDALKWTDCRNAMLWSQGYVWENGGFARHWVEHDGEPRLEYRKLPEP
ncbi:hypothetical protein IVB33_08205, partial [Bradyrhizobium sp. 24]|nr:hypothetical protein [Bradyrhizobium sp. 24]